MGDPGVQDASRRVKEMEQRITKWLNPNEPLVMRIQSLLVWEYPRRSAVLLVLVQLLFWVLATTWISSISLVSILGMVLFLVDTWKKQIWPEIRASRLAEWTSPLICRVGRWGSILRANQPSSSPVGLSTVTTRGERLSKQILEAQFPPQTPEDPDGWTPVHPRLLSVPEIAQELAQLITWLQDQALSWRQYRREHPNKFFVVAFAFFMAMWMIGRYVSGFSFCYGVAMGLLLMPGITYHGLLEKLYTRMEPHLTWPLRKLRLYRPAAENGESSSSRSAVEEEFYPEIDPEAVRALSKAICDSEEEGAPTPSSLSVGLSKEPSLADSEDDERRMEELAPGVDAMPSFDDIDHTDDELDAAHPMDFNPSHFGEGGTDSSEDDDTISRDLTAEQAASAALAGAAASESLSALTGSLVSQTLGAMMQSALQSVTGSSSSTDPRTGTRITYTRTAVGESVDFQQGPEAIQEEAEDAVDIDSEFDFLEDYDPSGEPRTKK